ERGEELVGEPGHAENRATDVDVRRVLPPDERHPDQKATDEQRADGERLPAAARGQAFETKYGTRPESDRHALPRQRFPVAWGEMIAARRRCLTRRRPRRRGCCGRRGR